MVRAWAVVHDGVKLSVGATFQQLKYCIASISVRRANVAALAIGVTNLTGGASGYRVPASATGVAAFQRVAVAIVLVGGARWVRT